MAMAAMNLHASANTHSLSFPSSSFHQQNVSRVCSNSKSFCRIIGFHSHTRGRKIKNRSDVVRVSAVATQSQNDVVSSSSSSEILLEVKGLKAVVAESRLEILQGIDLVIRQGEPLL